LVPALYAENSHLSSAWDFGDVGSRFARSLINARKALGMAEASETEKRLQSLLFSCFGDDGLIHRPPSSRAEGATSSPASVDGVTGIRLVLPSAGTFSATVLMD